MSERMVNISAWVVLVAGIGMSSCQGKPNAPAGLLSSPATRAQQSAANDYTKPYLTDEKMQKFITSMQEEHNPLALIFKKGGQMQNPLDLASRLEEFNAFARKYGFDDYQDYSAVWGRIMAGEMQLWAADMKKDSAKMFEKMMADAQEDLKKPGLTPERQKMDEQQIASSQKAFDDMNNNDSKSAVNAADLELVKKYKDQIDAAEKKYNSEK